MATTVAIFSFAGILGSVLLILLSENGDVASKSSECGDDVPRNVWGALSDHLWDAMRRKRDGETLTSWAADATSRLTRPRPPLTKPFRDAGCEAEARLRTFMVGFNEDAACLNRELAVRDMEQCVRSMVFAYNERLIPCRR